LDGNQSLPIEKENLVKFHRFLGPLNPSREWTIMFGQNPPLLGALDPNRLAQHF